MDAEQTGQVLPPLSLNEIVALPNVALHLDPARMGAIANDAIEDCRIDRESMKDWLARMQKGIDLAKLVKEDKTYPFPKAANVKYPLVTTAALQFNAKAYPAIVPGDAVVKPKVLGKDPRGIKAARGSRVAEFMSYQLTGTIEEWEEDTDKLLTLLPIVGTVVRKVWFDPAQGRIRCRLLTTGAFIVNDKVRTLGVAPRLTEELDLYPAEIAERVLSGTFLPGEYRAGDTNDRAAPERFIEQHRRLDLDGDGYEEPYIVTVHVSSQRVARIVADFEMRDVSAADDGKVTSIRRGSYFVAYHMLPSLDGGFWGTGFGLLLGDISDTINSIINLMMDAGHMASRGGGFIGSEFRIKGGSQQFKPGEWRMTTATGSAIKDSLVPLTFPGPDQTLFELLGLLVEAGKEVASIKDILMGDTGSKTMTATTTMALIEQGMAQFTAAYKRIFRALRAEFKLIAKINAETITSEEYNAFHDEVEPVIGQDGQPVIGPDGPMTQPVIFDPRQDFNLGDMDIVPVADPSSVTKMQQLAKAQVLTEAAQAGMVNPQAAAARLLEASGIDNIEELLPQPDPMQQQAAALNLQMLQAQLDEIAARIENLNADTMAKAQPKPGEDPIAARMQAQADMVSAQAQAEEAPLKAAETAANVRLKQEQAAAVRRKADVEEAKAQADIAMKAEANRRAEAEFYRAGAEQAAAGERADAESSARVQSMKDRKRDARGA